MRRVAAAIVCVLGIFLMVLGIGRMSWWAPSDMIAIKIDSEAVEKSPFIVLNQDVKKSFGAPITVDVKSNQKFSISQGRKEDTLAWLGDVKHATASRVEKDSFVFDVEGSEANAPDPAGADIWYETTPGDKDYTGRWESPKTGEWDLVIAGNGKDQAPTDVTISSPSHVGFAGPILLLVFGGVLFIIGLLGTIFIPKHFSGKPRDSRGRTRNFYATRSRPSKARMVAARGPRRSSRRVQSRRNYAIAAIVSLMVSSVALPASGEDKTEASYVIENMQLQRIVDNASKVVAHSDQSLNVEGLNSRVAEPELALRAANYAVRRQNPSHPQLSPVSGAGEEGFGIVRRYIQESLDWPRTVSMVTQSGKDENAQYIVMTQQDARSNYKVNEVVPVVQGQTALGAKKLPPQTVSWIGADDKINNLKTPKEALQTFVSLLNGDEAARSQFVSNDTVLTQVDSQNKIDEGAELVNPIENVIMEPEIKAFQSVDGDLLVSGVISTKIAQKPKPGKVIKLPAPQKALAGAEEVTGTVTIQTAEPVMIVVPQDGGPLQVVGFSRSYVTVKAD